MSNLTSKTHPIEVAFLPSAELPLNGKVGFTLAPGRRGKGMAGMHARDLDADMNRLRRQYGATTIVSLITEEEARSRVAVPIARARDAAQARAMAFHHAPVEAGEVHPDSELVELVQLLRDLVTRGQIVIVHDRAGGGRAATVSAALLIAQGTKPDSAVAVVRQVRPKAIEPAQERQLHRIAEQLAQRSSPLMNVVQCALDAKGYKYQRVPGATVLSSDFKGSNTTVRVLALTAERNEQIAMLGVLPLNVPEGARSAVGELLHRINWNLAVGGFEIDLSDGEVRYRTALDVEGGQLTEAMVNTQLGFATGAANRYFPAISAVAFGGVEPAEALATPQAA